MTSDDGDDDDDVIVAVVLAAVVVAVVAVDAGVAAVVVVVDAVVVAVLVAADGVGCCSAGPELLLLRVAAVGLLGRMSEGERSRGSWGLGSRPCFLLSEGEWKERLELVLVPIEGLREKNFFLVLCECVGLRGEGPREGQRKVSFFFLCCVCVGDDSRKGEGFVCDVCLCLSERGKGLGEVIVCEFFVCPRGIGGGNCCVVCEL